jgi:hypothetical protein
LDRAGVFARSRNISRSTVPSIRSRSFLVMRSLIGMARIFAITGPVASVPAAWTAFR